MTNAERRADRDTDIADRLAVWLANLVDNVETSSEIVLTLSQVVDGREHEIERCAHDLERSPADTAADLVGRARTCANNSSPKRVFNFAARAVGSTVVYAFALVSGDAPDGVSMPVVARRGLAAWFANVLQAPEVEEEVCVNLYRQATRHCGSEAVDQFVYEAALGQHLGTFVDAIVDAAEDDATSGVNVGSLYYIAEVKGSQERFTFEIVVDDLEPEDLEPLDEAHPRPWLDLGLLVGSFELNLTFGRHDRPEGTLRRRAAPRSRAEE